MRYFDFDPLRSEELVLNADLLALSTGIVPEDPTALEKMLKAPVTAEKFFLEAHVKLQPCLSAAAADSPFFSCNSDKSMST